MWRFMTIARIIASNSHIDYVARAEENGATSDAGDQTFGQFVAMVFPEEKIVGIIYDSRLINPEFAGFGPRLGPRPSLEPFSQNSKGEKGILLGIILLGTVFHGGTIEHSIPGRIIPAGQSVEKMKADDVAAFHSLPGGKAKMHYLSSLMLYAGGLGVPLVKAVIAQLDEHCAEEDRQMFKLLESSLEWKHTFSQVPL